MNSSNMTDWSEGRVVETRYGNGNETRYLRDRLVSITYRFPKGKKPSTIEGALESFGFPPDAKSLDQQSSSGFRAFDAPNPSYRNPLRCCGLVFQMVDIPADVSQIWVNFVNINDHFEDWPDEMKTAWREAGMASIVPPKRKIRVGAVPPGGSLLDAPFIREK
jgi:hypothetical protein